MPLRAELRDRLYPLLTVIIRKTYMIGLGKMLHYVCGRAGMLSMALYNLDKKDFTKLPGWYVGLALYRLKHLPEHIAHRRECMRAYLEQLPKEIVHPIVTAENIARATCVRLPINTANRESLVDHLEKAYIFVSDIWYEVPVSPVRYWHLFEKDNTAPGARETAKMMLNFPTHQDVEVNDVCRIVEQCKTWKK